MKFVLVHGGSYTSRCWEKIVPQLDLPAIAVDQPGRPGNPVEDMGSITVEDYRQNVAAAVASADDDVILVGHSLAGVSLAGALEAHPDRIRHVVFISCTIPEDGGNLFSLVAGGDVAETASQGMGNDRVPFDPDMIRNLMAHDMTEDQVAFALEIGVDEPGRAMSDPVSLKGYRETDAAKTWIRLTGDRIFPPELQDTMAARAGVTSFVDLDCGHLAMLSRPDEVAAILNDVARQAA